MAKAKKQKTPDPILPADIRNEQDHMIKNGLSEAIMGFTPGGSGVQLSQVDTLFKNERWYLISNMRQILSQMYVEHGLIQTVVDVPVDDGLRGGVEIKSKIMSADEVEELSIYLDENNIIHGGVGQALKWNRLFGGAGIVVLTDQDPEQPFQLSQVREDSPLEFRPVDMWELFWDKQNVEGYNPELQTQGFEHYNYYSKRLHKSRVLAMKGIIAPSFIRPRLRGWGISIVEALVRSINQYLKANDLCFEVLDEFKLDIFKIKNLTNTLLSEQGTEQVRRRIQLANFQKNYQNALTMDSEDDFDHKQLSFTGLSEVMEGIRMQIASDLRMPLTKVFGISAAGFNSGEDDIENYNAMVESQVRSKSKYDILRVVKICSQKLFGYVPDDIQIEFKPLRILSSEQEENVKTQRFARLMQAVSAGLMSTKEFKDACNKENLLTVQLDTTLEKIDLSPGEDDAESAPGPAAPKSQTAAKDTKEAKS